MYRKQFNICRGRVSVSHERPLSVQSLLTPKKSREMAMSLVVVSWATEAALYYIVKCGLLLFQIKLDICEWVDLKPHPRETIFWSLIAFERCGGIQFIQLNSVAGEEVNVIP